MSGASQGQNPAPFNPQGQGLFGTGPIGPPIGTGPLGSTSSGKGEEQPETNEGDSWLRGCCRMAPIVNGCCVRSEDQVVETLGEEVVLHGYEFPILRKIAPGEVSNMPEAPKDPWVPNAAMRNMMEQSQNPHPAHTAKSYGGVGLDDPSDQNEFNRRQEPPRGFQGSNPIPDMAALQQMQKEPKQQQMSSPSPIQDAPQQEAMKPAAAVAPPTKPGKVMMDEMYVMKEAWWCSYCCCAGIGCGHPAIFRLLTKCCCCRVNCEGNDTKIEHVDYEGCYQSICSCCFCHLVCQYPCRAGMPKCICCSETLVSCGKYPHRQVEQHNQTVEAGTQPMFEYLMFDAFTCWYCCCMGFACKQEPIACCSVKTVCGGCRYLCEEAIPECGEDGLCTCLFTWLTCYSLCSIPGKRENNPVCSCCNYRWRLHNHPAQISGGRSPTSGASPVALS